MSGCRSALATASPVLREVQQSWTVPSPIRDLCVERHQFPEYYQTRWDPKLNLAMSRKTSRSRSCCVCSTWRRLQRPLQYAICKPLLLIPENRTLEAKQGFSTGRGNLLCQRWGRRRFQGHVSSCQRWMHSRIGLLIVRFSSTKFRKVSETTVAPQVSQVCSIF